MIINDREEFLAKNFLISAQIIYIFRTMRSLITQLKTNCFYLLDVNILKNNFLNVK